MIRTLRRHIRSLRHRLFGLPIDAAQLHSDLHAGAIEAAWRESAWRVPMVFGEDV